MKTCKLCEVDKELEDFPFHDKEKGTYRAQCKECYSILRKKWRENDIENKREQNRKSYKKNSEKRIEKVKEYLKKNPEKYKKWQKKSATKKREEFRLFKSNFSCEKCGESHISCLDFHHLDPTKKEFLISKTVRTPIKRLKEIGKCIVLCANCHRKLHWEEKLNKD